MMRHDKRLTLFGGRTSSRVTVIDTVSNKNDADALAEPIKPKKRRGIINTAVVLLLLTALYFTIIYSGIPFIEKWRDIYIETAMDTYSHKWLATFFIPKKIIDDVIEKKEEYIRSQQMLESSWGQPNVENSDSDNDNDEINNIGNISENKRLFYQHFTMLDPESTERYLSAHPELTSSGYNKLLLNETKAAQRANLPMTIHGDPVLVIDSENGIVIAEVTGEGFVGKLAFITNAAQVRVGVSKYLGSVGQTVETIAKNNNAVLAINASGFADPEWKGNGGTVVGLLIKDGQTLSQPVHNGYLNIGFAKDNRLYIGVPVSEAHYRDAVEFMPALIINGKNVTDGSTGFGIQPRTTIGQSADGTVMFLTVDGRQIGYSLGCTVGDCATILAQYGALQASNLDGGSSTVMYYRGQIINKPSSTQGIGRLVPDAFVVDYATSVQNKS